MTPQQYAAWISKGAFGADKAARNQANLALTRIDLQTQGWDEAMINNFLGAREKSMKNEGTTQAPCPSRQAYLNWLENT